MKHFTIAEFVQTSTGLPNHPGAEELANLEALVEHVLDPLREALGVPLSVNSGYRSPAVNERVGGSRTSDHVKGRAADLVVGPKPGVWREGWTPERLARAVASSGLPFDQVIWEPTWVHVSWRPTPRGEVRRKVGSSYPMWDPS